MDFIKIRLSFVLICTLWGSGVEAQSLLNNTAAAMEQFTNDSQTKYSITSLTVLNAITGEPLYQHNENVGLPTASTLKLITAATAYAVLGKDFTFETGLLYSGQIRNDTLFGDLIIRGSGDPTLGSWRYASTKPQRVFAQWVKAVQKAGIQVVQGQVIGDASLFDSQTTPGGWPWEDMGNYYGAGSSALTWHENQYDLYLSPGARKGAAVKLLKTNPEIKQLAFVNELKTGSAHSGDQTYIYAAPYGHTAYLRGTAPAENSSFSVSGSIPDPALFVGNQLKIKLERNGVHIMQPSRTSRLMKGETVESSLPLTRLTTFRSPKLKAINHWFLKRSINLYGENLVKTIAVKQGGRVDTESGVQAIIDFWRKRGIDKEALHIFDGSGLSPSTRVTTAALAKILFKAKKEKWFSAYYENIPVIHNIRMKSGHIHGVAAYSGFLKSKTGTPLIFSFIIDNYNGSSSRLTAKIFKLFDRIKT